jgi:hypothetical protein
MLTEESQLLINSFLGKSNVQSYMKDDYMKQLYQSLSNKSFHTSKIELSHSQMKYPQSDFLAKSLSRKILEKKNALTIKWTILGKHSVQITLHIYLKDDEDFPDTKLLVKAISFIASFSDRDRKMTIHLCLLPDKKIIRKNQQKISKLSVNSGSNYFSDIESEICVFRREECIKVLFHEIIHGLRCSKLGSQGKITERLCQKYNLKSKDILIDESYTEIWAKIMNCFFISSLTNSSTKFQHFCTMMSLEKEFSLYQANKVKQFVKKSNDKNLDKDTNVSAYFLVVGEIFSNIKGFLKTCGHNPYLQDHNKCFDFILNQDKLVKRNISKKDIHYNTMRMSLIELKV